MGSWEKKKRKTKVYLDGGSNGRLKTKRNIKLERNSRKQKNLGNDVLILICFLSTYISAEPGDLSKKKCKEYAKYVYVMEESPVLTRRAMKQKVSTCGIIETPLIIGGTNASPKEFPHMAIIGYGKSKFDPNMAWRCGGSLISEYYVMSASHCIGGGMLEGGGPQVIRVGVIDLNKNYESEIQEREIKHILKHPKYNATKKYNDIALFQMDTPVTFTAYVRPACLHVDTDFIYPKVIATGFGKTSFDASHGSKKLMKVTLNMLETKSCEKYFKNEIANGGSLSEGILRSQLCAGVLKVSKDTCQGDSGGPLQIVLKEPYCMYSIVGIISFGKFCGFLNQPAIYTNVASYIDWLEKTVWPEYFN